MARTKKPSSRKRRKTVLPALGAGMSLAMVGGASASTTAPMTDVGSQAINPAITLHEEELSDVSLGTFYVFDKEHDPLGDNVERCRPRLRRLRRSTRRRRCGGARGCGGCGGARGCGGCGGARGCGGCGGARGCGCGGEAAAAEAEPAVWAARWRAPAAAAQVRAGSGRRRAGSTPADDEGPEGPCLPQVTYNYVDTRRSSWPGLEGPGLDHFFDAISTCGCAIRHARPRQMVATIPRRRARCSDANAQARATELWQPPIRLALAVRNCGECVRTNVMTADHGTSFTRRNSKDVPQFAPNFTVYVLPPDVVCLYSEDRKFFLHGELYCALASAIGEGGRSFRELVRELEQDFPPDQIQEALKRLVDRRYVVPASRSSAGAVARLLGEPRPAAGDR